jgi:hypothetical protein
LDSKPAPLSNPMQLPSAPNGAKSKQNPDNVANDNADQGDNAPGKSPTLTPRDNSPTGIKTFRVQNQVYTGSFTPDPLTGDLSGTGKIAWDNGDRYEGTVVRGLREGKGEFIWNNGQRYKGNWAKGLPNGHGSIQFPNGSKYNGDMRDGEANGKGTLLFNNGDRYTGEVRYSYW